MLQVKEPNPKDGVGSTKVHLTSVPPIVGVLASLSFLEGKLKYGAWNWRMTPVRASVYTDALSRHLAKYLSGEECDPVTHVPHLGSIIACAGILADAKLQGTLIDDRAPASPATVLAIEGLAATVVHLQALFAEHSPKHYSIGDSLGE